jgi:hypothetical protein
MDTDYITTQYLGHDEVRVCPRHRTIILPGDEAECGCSYTVPATWRSDLGYVYRYDRAALGTFGDEDEEE